MGGMATACAVSSSPSMAAATSGLLPRVLPSNNALRCVALPARLPAQSSRRLSESRRFPLLHVKASSDETSAVDAGEVFTDLKEKWDAVENKSTVLIYGGGAVVAVWLSSILVGAINSVPLLPKIMELVGLGYTGWFVYRYLLFKSSRKELAEDIESLKKKVAGTEQ